MPMDAIREVIEMGKMNDLKEKEIRAAYCETLIDEAKHNDRIVVINCDLCSSMGLKPFAATFPERSINVGIQEANGCSMAGGMSAAGMIPFFNTFSVFATRRVYDQIFMCCAYPRLNVKIIGGDAGISATYNGGTHMPFEDIGIMRVMPEITILEPSDPYMAEMLTRLMVKTYGVQYMRFTRKTLPCIYDENTSFEFGKAIVVKEGTDATIISCGILLHEALIASEILKKEGYSVRVVDMFTIKPADRECILQSVEQTGAILTAENHQIIGGLGSAVSEILAEAGVGIPFSRLGIKGEFGEVGEMSYLMERFHLTASYIADETRVLIQKKK